MKIYAHPFYIEDTPGIDFENADSDLRMGTFETVAQGIRESSLVDYSSHFGILRC